MSTPPEDLAGKFLAEIEAAIEKHTRAYRWDAFWYQFVVIVSGICGLISLAVGAKGHAFLAGGLGGVTTIGTILTQTLHCVKAQGWQDRMKAELDGIRVQFVYEHNSAPTAQALAGLSKQYRELTTKMSKEWERILSSQSGGLNVRLSKIKSASDEA
jgi:hypothetical protein